MRFRRALRPGILTILFAWVLTAWPGVSQVTKPGEADLSSRWATEPDSPDSYDCSVRGVPIAPLIVWVKEECWGGRTTSASVSGWEQWHLYAWFLVGEKRLVRLTGFHSVGTRPLPAESFVTRDSAGFTIVINSPDIELPEWSVDPIPSVDIGSVEGEEEEYLAGPWSSVRLPDGRIAISNAQTNELRLFTEEGQFIRAVGRRGEGPGEFSIISAVMLGREDTLVVTDAGQARLSLFSSSGEFGRIINLAPLEGRTPRLGGILSDNVGVFRVSFFDRSRGGSRSVRDTLLLATRPLEGGEAKILGRFPSREKFNHVLLSGGVAAWNLPFGRAAHYAVARDRVWVGVSDTYEIRAYDADGILSRVVRLDRTTQPIVPWIRDRFFEHQLAEAEDDDQRRARANIHRIIEFAPRYPAFSDIQADADGHLWVQEYVPPWADEAPLWRVFDAAGRAVATVRTPRGMMVHEIGPDYLMGLWIDDLGAEHIRVYRLRRGDR